MPCHPDRVRRNAMAGSTTVVQRPVKAQDAGSSPALPATCTCGVADAAQQIVTALQQFRDNGRIARVINVGRAVYEHLVDESTRHGVLAHEFSFRGVHVNYSPDYPFDWIEVK